MATFFWKVLLWVCLCLVLTFRVEAQEQETGTQLLCDAKAHVEMFVAFHESGLSDMEAMAEVNAAVHKTTCMIISAAFFRGEQLGTAETDIGTLAIVEVLLVGINTGHDKWRRIPPMLQYTTFLIAKSEEALLPLSLVEWRPEYAQNAPDWQEWFKRAEITKRAQPRFQWKSCCEHADRVKTQFRVNKVNGEDEWWFLDPQTQKWIEIPDYLIHYEDDPTMPKQLKVEGVLFVYSGTVTCFWPPQSGG